MYPKRIFLIVVLFLVAGCRPQETAVQGTPALWQVQTSTGLSWLGESFNTCALKQDNVGLIVTELPGPTLDIAMADFSFRLGDPEQTPSFAVIVASEELILIVHPSNLVRSIKLSDLQEIYTRGIRNWNDLMPEKADEERPIQVWSYPPGDDLSTIFEAAILGEGKMDAYTRLAPHPEAMLRVVAEDPGAIGYLPARWLDDSVRQVQMEGVEMGSLRKPIVALAAIEPEGNRREWLHCVEGLIANPQQ
ncbi:MAG: substrate-binding domain-containing protein [Anaerolineaceae bacterium]|nr:substrate-binding domain-containing protein [Anaerolineaceae bacterium]